MNLHDIISLLWSLQAGTGGAGEAETRETHTAFVFLVGDAAYKMKKPVRLPYLDFTTLARRKAALEEELRINRQLAGGIYRRVFPISMQADGSVVPDGDGEPVEWLLEMQRLPENDMLDRRLAHRNISVGEVRAIGQRLCDFYAKTGRRQEGGEIYLRHLRQESAINREHLLSMRSQLQPQLSISSFYLDLAVSLIERYAGEILQRGAARLIVDGHGDLRLEHICVSSPPIIFDRLEFDHNMRQIDVYDEINYLGLESELAGYGWIGRDLMSFISQRLGDPPSEGLLQTYSLFRLLLRARLTIDHLLEPFPKTPEKWIAHAKIYLSRAEELAAIADSA